MSADIFAEWFRKQGKQVVRTQSSYWVDRGTRAFQAFPYHWLIEPTQDELDGLLKENKAITLRYSTPVNAPSGYVSYHAVLKDNAYDISNLGKRTRKNIRHGLDRSQVVPISFERLAGEGFSLLLDTMDRQGRNSDITQKEWETLCVSAGDLPGFETWGVLVGSKLAASALVFRMDDYYYILYQQSLRQFLSENVNNALTFVLTQELVKRPEMKSIFYGLHSLDAPVSLDEFKFHMGYIAKPVRQRVVFHPWLRSFVNDTSHWVAHKLLNWNLGNPMLSKAEGMLRFYLDGNQQLSLQQWPECLISQKQEILKSCGSEEISTFKEARHLN
jgi:hypothetical protein